MADHQLGRGERKTVSTTPQNENRGGGRPRRDFLFSWLSLSDARFDYRHN